MSRYAAGMAMENTVLVLLLLLLLSLLLLFNIVLRQPVTM